MKLDALQKRIRELEDVNRTLVLQSHRSSNDKGNPTTVKPDIPTKVDEVQKTHETLKKPVLQSTKAPLKPMLRSEGLPGLNTKWMVESISSKIGKGPIPEKSESIPMRPIHQVPIQSAIGEAIEEFGNVSQQGKSGGNLGDPDDSSLSGSDSDSSNSQTSNKHWKQKSKSRKTSAGSKLRVKPIEPEKYDGSADPMKYSRHLRSIVLYMKDGNVPTEDQCQRASHFLEGKAAQVYEQEVAMHLSQLTLPEMYTIIFNRCFPSNFRSEVRLQIQHLRQNEKTV